MTVHSPSKDKVLTPYIKALVLNPPNFTPDDLAAVIKLIFSDRASEIQVAAFLTSLRQRELDHESVYIAAAVNTVLEFAETIEDHLVDEAGYIDIVGTGGMAKIHLMCRHHRRLLPPEWDSLFVNMAVKLAHPRLALVIC